jgi:CheB methylesterase
LGLCGFSFGLGPNKKNKTQVCATAGLRIAMGRDGLKGCEALANQNAPIIVQDEAASVVWGMPGFVARAGLAEKILPLNQIGTEISRRARLQPALHPAY